MGGFLRLAGEGLVEVGFFQWVRKVNSRSDPFPPEEQATFSTPHNAWASTKFKRLEA
jgi:hypothetical protein